MVGSAFKSRRFLLLAALTAQPFGSVSMAQVTTGPDGRTLTTADTTSRRKTLFDSRDAVLAAAFTGLTVAMLPLDRQIAADLQNPATQANRFLDNAATNVEYLSTPGAYYIGGGLYVLGRLTRQRDVADVGWHGTEAVLLSSGVTNLLKGILGRSRPFVSNNKEPHAFNFGRGFGVSDRQSFPSGHTTTAFAAASVVVSEMRRFHPKSVWVVAPVMYGGATLVGLSRMYNNKHWASDIVLGAAVGTFGGLKVVRYSHAHPNNKVDRFMLRATLLPDASGGAVLAFTLPAP